MDHCGHGLIARLHFHVGTRDYAAFVDSAAMLMGQTAASCAMDAEWPRGTDTVAAGIQS